MDPIDTALRRIKERTAEYEARHEAAIGSAAARQAATDKVHSLIVMPAFDGLQGELKARDILIAWAGDSTVTVQAPFGFGRLEFRYNDSDTLIVSMSVGSSPEPSRMRSVQDTSAALAKLNSEFARSVIAALLERIFDETHPRYVLSPRKGVPWYYLGTGEFDVALAIWAVLIMAMIGTCSILGD